MPLRLVALDEGPDILIDRDMLVIGRHPQCDARLDSIRVSRRHCCMIRDHDEVLVRDLGSTNGIRINGVRVEKGRLQPRDELSIAHIRFRLDDGQAGGMTQAEPSALGLARVEDGHGRDEGLEARPHGENPIAAVLRELLPADMADRCRIEVIVRMPSEDGAPGGGSRDEGAESVGVPVEAMDSGSRGISSAS